MRDQNSSAPPISEVNACMDMRQTCEYLKISVTADQLVAGRYLESRGLMFCGHFGTENAIEKADQLFGIECEKALAVGLIQ